MPDTTADAVSIVLLAHNEADTIQQEIRDFYRTIVRRLPDCEFIVAEDGSRDGTRTRIEQVRPEIPLRLIGGTERLGYSKAVLGAVAAASRPWIFLCDSGLKHDPEDFWKLWQVRHSYDLIIGRKVNRRDQLHRRLLTIGYNFLLRMLFAYNVHDVDSGMRLFNRQVVERVINDRLTFRGFVSTEIVLRSIHRGLRYAEMPVSYRLRAGRSRALPVRRLPGAILSVLRDLWGLKHELRENGHPGSTRG